jgi:hypothetical protein
VSTLLSSHQAKLIASRPSGFGAILGSYFNGLAQDYYYRKEMKRVGGDHRKAGNAFNLEWTRLRCLFPFAM